LAILGRHLRQGVTGVLSYVNRQNIQLLKASDFNEQPRKRGCDPNVTVQSKCKAAKEENEARETLETIWLKPADADRILILRRFADIS